MRSRTGGNPANPNLSVGLDAGIILQLCGGTATLVPPYGMATKYHAGWNKRSGSTYRLA